MDIEYEATFKNINKDKIRAKLEEIGATLIKPEFLQRRSVFHLPEGHKINGGWARVRDESDCVTMSLKIVDGYKIENQKEVCLQINNFEEGKKLLTFLGCREKAFQESKRELWKLDGVEITIDEWPFLEPFVEVEGKSEEEVKNVSEKMGFDYKNAMFCAVGTLYSEKYNLSEDIINNETPEILFDAKNPFLKKNS